MLQKKQFIKKAVTRYQIRRAPDRCLYLLIVNFARPAGVISVYFIDGLFILVVTIFVDICGFCKVLNNVLQISSDLVLLTP